MGFVLGSVTLRGMAFSGNSAIRDSGPAAKIHTGLLCGGRAKTKAPAGSHLRQDSVTHGPAALAGGGIALTPGHTWSMAPTWHSSRSMH